ncbi:MAG: DUF1501 domain-containing protein [Myxococcota bacterium]|nr:DUF1501 domain-containing protein [Myxococcota bacterium]
MSESHRIKSHLTRRHFLRRGLSVSAGALTVGATPLMGQFARAQALNPDAPDRYYIFCYFGGGWDVLLALDPRDPRQFTSDMTSLQRTRIQPGYEMLSLPDADIHRTSDGRIFGPHLGELLRHTDRLAVVRGINMETVAHAGGRRRFLTGKPPSGVLARGSNGATWLASRLGGDDLIPNLSLRVESYNTDQPNYATALRVDTVPDLLRALRPSDPRLFPTLRRQVDHTLRAASLCPPSLQSRAWQKAEFARARSREIVSQGLGSLFDFGARNPLMEELRGHYGFNQVNNSPGVAAALAAQAITTGVSRCVTVNLVGGLDTHDGNSWSQQQGPRQQQGFDAVARLMDDLANRPYDDRSSWLDHTIIVGFSEFSRTPLLNARGGRDHHITNSCFLAGGSVRGGQIIGASTNVAMQASPTNTHTGLPHPDGVILKPEHILRSLYDEIGIDDRPDLRVRRLDTLLRT